jgi:hypothetical protein
VAPQTFSVEFTVVADNVVVAPVAFNVLVATREVAERVVAVVFPYVESPVTVIVVAVTPARVDVPVTPSVPVDASEVPVIA